MLDVATTAFIDSDATGTRLIPQQSVLFTDHVALVVGEQVNHLIARGEPAAVIGLGFGDGDEVAVDTPGFMPVVPDLLAVFLEELICFFLGIHVPRMNG